MKKHKNKIIVAAVIVALLVGAWFYGDSRQARRDSPASPITSGYSLENNNEVPVSSGDIEIAPTVSPEDSVDDNLSTVTPTPNGDTEELSTDPLPTVTGSESDDSADPDITEAPTEAPSDTATPSPSPTEPAQPTMDINPDTGMDKYLTDPVPSGMPLPVEPQDMVVGNDSFTVTLTVRCDTILDNMYLLDKEKHELVPEDAVIFPVTTITVYAGESVFNVLQREMKRAKIHMEFVNTPIYNSAYIEGINNLYEFDVGELSGWMYCVNDWYPNYGCSRYLLKPGDVIEWRYTCELGRDLGQFWIH